LPCIIPGGSIRVVVPPDGSDWFITFQHQSFTAMTTSDATLTPVFSGTPQMLNSAVIFTLVNSLPFEQEWLSSNSSTLTQTESKYMQELAKLREEMKVIIKLPKQLDNNLVPISTDFGLVNGRITYKEEKKDLLTPEAPPTSCAIPSLPDIEDLPQLAKRLQKDNPSDKDKEKWLKIARMFDEPEQVDTSRSVSALSGGKELQSIPAKRPSLKGTNTPL